MIYYIVEVEADTLNERVMSSHDNLVTAMRVMEGYKRDAEVQTTSFTYRIDTVPSNEEVRERNAAIPADPHKRLNQYDKMLLNAEFAKAKMDHEEGYPGSDSIRTRDFTSPELFPDTGKFISQEWCKECGAFVPYEQARIIHAAWHNKLLP